MIPRLPLAAAALVAALAWLAPPAAQAQADEAVPQVTRTFALVDARVVQAPGRVLDRATVVVRDGRILAVGPDAAIPFDAERIEADSLTVYAGFIDGLSHAGIPKPQEERGNQQNRPDDPGNPPNADAGIQPDRDARALLDPGDKSIEQLRKAGFTVAHTVPHGRMLPGTGALILLAGDDPNALVLDGGTSLFAQFRPAQGMYPGTDMAVMAKLRQLYREAQRRQRVETLYAANPTGLDRPAYDPVHYAFFPVLDGDRAVFFHTQNALEIHRALALRETLGFPLVLTGLAQSFMALDALRDAGVPLLLTLDLPEEKKPKKDGSDPDSTAGDEVAPPADSVHVMTPEAPGSFFISDQRTRSYEDVEAEKGRLEARVRFEREKYLKTAGWMHEAGLRFGFTTADLDKPEEALDHLRLMVEHGLPEDAALAALTTHPADLFGLAGNAGTVERGKLANLVVTDGPLFDEETTIRYVFVDGQRFEMEASRPGAGGPATVNPAGTWSFVVASPDGDVEGTITITGSAGSFRGTINAAVMPGPVDLDDVTISGNTLSFSFDAGEMGRIEAEASIEGDRLDGTLTAAAFGSLPITGSRTAGPDGR